MVSLIPDRPDGYFSRGLFYHRQKNYQLALAEYQQALTKDEKYTPAIGNIGLIKYEQGKTEAAIQQWQSVLVIDREKAAAQMATAVALYAQGNRSRAFRIAQSALRIDKEFADLEYLKKNLWGKKLIADAQKLLEEPQMKQFISSLDNKPENK